MNHAPTHNIHLLLTREQAAMLQNLLCDNARTWNGPIRAVLAQQVSATELHNAQAKLQGRPL